MSIHLRLSIPLTKKTHFRRKEEHKSYRRGLKMLQPFPATTAGQGTCHSADRLHPETGKGKGADGTPAKMDGPGVRVVPASCRRDAHGEVLPFGRLHDRTDGPPLHVPTVGIQQKPLLRRAQEKPLHNGRHRADKDRAGRKRKTLCPAHQREEYPRLVQRYSNLNRKAVDSSCNGYKYLCANIKNAGNIIALPAFFIFLHLERGNSPQNILEFEEALC